MGTTNLCVIVLAVAVSIIATAFFLGFGAAGLGASAALGSGFLGLTVILVAVKLGILGVFVTGWGRNLDMVAD